MEMVKYPSIGQFRDVVKEVTSSTQFIGLDDDGKAQFNPHAELPTLQFTGTVKLHGTNAAVGFDPITNQMWVQNRKRIITPEDDNAGFAAFVEDRKNDFELIFNKMTKWFNGTIIIYGEWCGGNIQSGVALNQLEKMFVIFDILVDGVWINDLTSIPPCNHIRTITEFPIFSMSIDFNNPDINHLIQLTELVESECPIGKEFGVSGTGEGIVWKCLHNGMMLRFKVKGEKHSSSNVKKLVEIDPVKLASITEFVDYTVTENRMNQGIDEVFTTTNREPDIKLVGEFIRWMNNDVFKEELDTLTESGLKPKDVVKYMSRKMVPWFKEQYF